MTERPTSQTDVFLTVTVVSYLLAVYLASSIPGLSRSVHLSVGLMLLGVILRSARVELRLRWNLAIPLFWTFTAYAFASVLWSVVHVEALTSGVGLVVDVLGATLLWVALQNGVRLQHVGIAAALGASVQAIIALNQYLGEGVTRSEGLTGNANALAIQLSITAFLVLLANGRRWWGQVLPLLLIVTATVVSGSRKLIFVWASYSVLLFQGLVLQLRRSRVLVAVILVSLPLAGYALMTFGSHLVAPLEELVVVQRLEGTLEGRGIVTRSGLISDALDRWWEKPLVGYGINQYRQISALSLYSHNNYTEVLANFGVIGILLFYAIHVVLAVQAVRAAITGDRGAWVVLAIIATTLLMDVARVSYGGRLTWIMFAVMAYHVDSVRPHPHGRAREGRRLQDVES